MNQDDSEEEHPLEDQGDQCAADDGGDPCVCLLNPAFADLPLSLCQSVMRSIINHYSLLYVLLLLVIRKIVIKVAIRQ